jgi:uncharacterized protein (TIGR03083 family)
MERDEVWRTIDEERSLLADLLDSLRADEWDSPTLCEQWRVRDVVAHLALSTLPPGRAVTEMVRYRGNFNRMVHDLACRHADSREPDQLVAQLRALVGSRRHVIGTTPMDPLVDVLVHGQDITVPLGRSRSMPTDAAVAAADRVWSMGFPHRARRRLGGLRLVAIDAEWNAGEGPEVRGPIAVLLLVLTGRRARLDELGGAGVERLRSPLPL